MKVTEFLRIQILRICFNGPGFLLEFEILKSVILHDLMYNVPGILVNVPKFCYYTKTPTKNFYTGL